MIRKKIVQILLVFKKYLNIQKSKLPRLCLFLFFILKIFLPSSFYYPWKINSICYEKEKRTLLYLFVIFFFFTQNIIIILDVVLVIIFNVDVFFSSFFYINIHFKITNCSTIKKFFFSFSSKPFLPLRILQCVSFSFYL